MKITTFFDVDFRDFATYDVYRKIASYVDGLKPSSRKIVHVVDKLNITSPAKVSQLANRVADMTEYLHGEGSLAGVIVNLAQDFPGANNINLLLPKGSFGNRTIQDASAARYIYTLKAPMFNKIIHGDDRNILVNQNFEGTDIEPVYFLPTLPLILVNGSEGIGNGFAQKILPRDPAVLLDVVKKYLKTGKLPAVIPPFFKGFKGTITQDPETKSWAIWGCYEKVDRTTIRITEVPIGYDLESYRKMLDTLEEKKIIRDYKDGSVDNKFSTIVKVDMDFLKQPEQKILEKLKLVKRVSENFTCLGEDNSVFEFDSEIELLQRYIDFRLMQYSERKRFLCNKLNDEATYISERVRFIGLLLDDKIVVAKKTKVQIEEQLVLNNFIKKDDSFDYLTGMPIHSLSQEKYDDLKRQLADKRAEFELVSKTTPDSMWVEDMNKLKL